MKRLLLLLGLLPAPSFALDAPVVDITATSDGDSVYATLAWDPVPGAVRYQVFRQDQFLGTSSLISGNATSPFQTAVPTGWNWQAQPDILKFFEVIASDEPVLRYVLDLSGENTSVTVPHADNLNIDSPFTIEAWVFARDYQYPGHQTYVFPVNNIIGKHDDIGWGGRGYNLDLESGHPRIEIATSNTSELYISSPDVITLNQWHHIAGCWNGTDLMIYVDGILKNSQPLPSIYAVGVGDIVIGCRYTYDNYWWDGTFAGIMISNECKYNSNFVPTWPLVRSPTTMAYWSFNQSEGQIVHDDSGNYHNGVKANGEWIPQLENIEVPPPPSHFVLDLNSRNTSVTVPHSQELNLSGPFTLEAWVMARDFEYPGHQHSQNSINVIIDKRDDTGWGRGYGLSIQSGHPVCSVALSYWSDVNVESSMIIELNRWYHIAGCYNGDVYSLFVDGILQNTLSIPSTYIIGTGELVMGSRYTHDQYWWDGQFGGTMISNSCKYSGNFTPIWPLVQDESTVAYWDFNQSTGTTILDVSGHGHEGALSNGLLVPFQNGIPR